MFCQNRICLCIPGTIWNQSRHKLQQIWLDSNLVSGCFFVILRVYILKQICCLFVKRMSFFDYKRRDQFLVHQWIQIPDGTDIRSLCTKKIHMKHIRFRLHALLFFIGNRMQHRRRNKNQISLFHIISAASLLNPCKFCLLMPVRSDIRILLP